MTRVRILGFWQEETRLYVTQDAAVARVIGLDNDAVEYSNVRHFFPDRRLIFNVTLEGVFVGKTAISVGVTGGYQRVMVNQ